MNELIEKSWNGVGTKSNIFRILCTCAGLYRCFRHSYFSFVVRLLCSADFFIYFIFIRLFLCLPLRLFVLFFSYTFIYFVIAKIATTITMKTDKALLWRIDSAVRDSFVCLHSGQITRDETIVAKTKAALRRRRWRKMDKIAERKRCEKMANGRSNATKEIHFELTFRLGIDRLCNCSVKHCDISGGN